MADMKLLGMFAAFDQSVAEATGDQTSYSEFLDMLLQAKSGYRQERKTGYRIKAAKFTLHERSKTSIVTAWPSHFDVNQPVSKRGVDQTVSIGAVTVPRFGLLDEWAVAPTRPSDSGMDRGH